MAILKSIMLSVLIILSTLNQHTAFLKDKIIDQKVSGIIVPHHLLVDSFIDKFYQQIKKHNDYDTIFLISPNHFGYGYNYIQTTNQQNSKVFNLKLDQKLIQRLSEEKTAFIENRYYPQEHGITVHISYINKYFPNSKVIPIIIKNTTPQKQLDQLVENIEKLETGSTLIIASIDFTHYTDESIALKNDQRTIEWLKTFAKKASSEKTYEQIQNLAKSLDNSTKESVAMDSPESLYIIATLMRKKEATDFSLWERTSSASLTGLTNPELNTSHIFGFFH